MVDTTFSNVNKGNQLPITPVTQIEPIDSLTPRQEQDTDYGWSVEETTNIPILESLNMPSPLLEDETTREELKQAIQDNDNTIANLAYLHTYESIETDPDFFLTEERLIEDEVPLEFWDSIIKSRSDTEYGMRVIKLKQALKNEELIQSQGGVGLLKRLGYNLIDEAALALTFATLGAGSALTWGGKGITTANKVSRLKKGLTNGTIVAGEAMAIENVLATANDHLDIKDVLLAGGVGLFLGGSLSAVFHRSGKSGLKDNEKLNEDFSNDVMNLNPENGSYHTDTAGAQRATTGKQFHTESTEEILNRMNVPKTTKNWLQKLLPRIDIVGRLLESDNKITRGLGKLLAEDGVGVKGVTNEIAATQIATKLRYVYQVLYKRVSNHAFDNWYANTAYTWYEKPFKRKVFMKQVSQHIRGNLSKDENVIEAAEAISQNYKRILGDLKESGVKGFDGVMENAKYLPRIHKTERRLMLYRRYGVRNVTELVSRGIRKFNDSLSKADSDKIASAYLKKLDDLDKRGINTLDFGADNAARMEELLKELDLEDSVVESIMVSMRKKTGQKTGVPSQAKFRLGIDETAFITKPSRTNEATVDDDYFKTFRNDLDDEIKFSDLLEDDAEVLMDNYIHQMAGHIALAKKGIKSEAEFKKHLEAVVAENKELGALTEAQVNKNVDKLQVLYNSVIGRPVENTSAFWQRSTRIFRDLNFMTYMNQVGFAQIAEFGNALGMVGWRTMFTQIPEIRRIMKSGVDDDDFLSEMEVVVGLGTERMRGEVMTRYDDILPEAALTGKLDIIMGVGRKITADISGMMPITSFMHRLTSRAMGQKFLNLAYRAVDDLGEVKLSKLSKTDRNRLKSYGMTDEGLENVLKHIKKYANDGKSDMFKGKKLKKFNTEKWAKTEEGRRAVEDLSDAMFIMGRKAVQENDIGTSVWHMHTSTGKLFTQFRSFMLNAYTKQLQYNIEMADVQTANMFMSSVMFAGVGYTLQTKLNAIGRHDEEDYLAKRLTPEEIGKASWQRAGWASILPMIADTIWSHAGNDPYFRYGRSTGLASDMFMGIPAASVVNKADGAIKGVAHGIRTDQEISRNDFRNITKLIPFNNALIIKQYLENLSQEFPDIYKQ